MVFVVFTTEDDFHIGRSMLKVALIKLLESRLVLELSLVFFGLVMLNWCSDHASVL